MMVSVLHYMATGNVVLRNRYSIAEHCRLNPKQEDVCGSMDDPNFGLLSNWDIFRHNYLIWTVIFFGIGLQYNLLDKTRFQHITLSLSSEAYDWAVYAVLGGAVLVGLTFFGYLFTLYWITSPLLVVFYILYALTVTGCSAYVTLYVYPLKDFHFHHWFIYLILSTLICHHNQIITIGHAMVTGFFMEGIAHYGFDPVWQKVDLQDRWVEIKYQLK